MRCVLVEGVKIRGYERIPFCYFSNDDNIAQKLTFEEMIILNKCDGKHDLEKNDLLMGLIFEKKIVRALRKEEKVDVEEWQKFRKCENVYMPLMNLQITGLCNYNCIHCFNAIDNAPLNTELSLEEIVKLLDEAEECGVNAVLITGGEPMVHPHFLEIIKEIYKHHLYVFELNTNGAFINERILDEFKAIGCNPLIKISYDGVNYHDWMRNQKGSEQIAIDAIKLCIKKGFKVMVQYNVNKVNLDTVNESLKMLDDLGIDRIRFLPTTPSPRWLKNSNGRTLSIAEYYDFAISVTKFYIDNKLKCSLQIWQIIDVFNNIAYFPAIRGFNEGYDDDLPLCKGNRGMIAIGSNGRVYPCLQMSGRYDELNINLGNVKTDGLKKLLQRSSPYFKHICQTLKEKREFNPECQKCKYFMLCWGGCSALGFIEKNNILGKSSLNCYFFNNNIYGKMEKALTGALLAAPNPDEAISMMTKYREQNKL